MYAASALSLAFEALLDLTGNPPMNPPCAHRGNLCGEVPAIEWCSGEGEATYREVHVGDGWDGVPTKTQRAEAGDARVSDLDEAYRLVG